MTLPQFLSLREQGSCTDFSSPFADLQLRTLHGFNATRKVNKMCSILACKFCTQEDYSYLFALGDEGGKVNIHNSLALHNELWPKPKPFYHNVWNGFVDLWEDKILEGYSHRNTVYDIAWMTGELKLVSVAGDNAAILRDVARQSSSGDSTHGIRLFVGHTASVKTVDFSPNKHIFATGGRDGRIATWDIRVSNESPDHLISDAHQTLRPTASQTTGYSRSKRGQLLSGGNASSVLSLLFRDEHTLISTGDRDCSIKVWDLRKSYSIQGRLPIPVNMLPHPDPNNMRYFSTLAIDPNKVKLYAASNSHNIYCYNATTFDKEPVTIFQGANINSNYVRMCLSPDGRYLLSGSSNGYAHIWSTDSKGNSVRPPLLKLSGHEEEVTCVAWSTFPDTKLLTCSDDDFHSIQLWEVCMDIGGWREGTFGKAQHLPDDSEVLRLSESVRFTPPPRPALRSIQPTSPMSPVYLKDLPNSVIDGTSRHVCMPARVCVRTADWLTQYRRSSGSAEKSATTFSLPAPQGSQSTGSKRMFKSKSSFQEKKGRHTKSLLQYFKSTQKTETSQPRTSHNENQPCTSLHREGVSPLKERDQRDNSQADTSIDR